MLERTRTPAMTRANTFVAYVSSAGDALTTWPGPGLVIRVHRLRMRTWQTEFATADLRATATAAPPTPGQGGAFDLYGWITTAPPPRALAQTRA
ncbi:hypothetical protein [Kibdelosporangium persicum]|uniref:hypothetical protein n=1 Tax=Kibdelosporangium persicum TaxID=2698649 RepID=UPI001566685B|nr:hypothetical protein [Kibdelosporangium persicum]